jgi:hypothetical protein
MIKQVADAITDGHREVAEGEALVKLALDEILERQQRLGHGRGIVWGTNMLAPDLQADDSTVPAPRLEPPTTPELIAYIIDREAAGRWVTAGAALIQLETRYCALNPEELDERSFADYCDKHLPWGAKRARELMGRMLKGDVADQNQSMVSAKQASALERAIVAIREHADKSNRLIAKEIGVDEGTVRRARNHSARDSAVDSRTGMDGRRRRAPKRGKNDDRWRVLPPDGEGECDYDPEWEKAFADDSDADLRRNATEWQLAEVKRIAKDFGLLRSGTQPGEITKAVIKEALRCSRVWRELANELTKRRR